MTFPLQRILVVDDDPVYLERLARALRARGCTVATADSAESATEAAAGWSLRPPSWT